MEKAHLKPGLSRVQWTNENNITLAKESMRFLREIEVELAVLGERKVDINFTPQVTAGFFGGRLSAEKLEYNSER